MPGLKVVSPGTPYDAKGLLKSAIRDDNLIIFLEHKKSYRLVRGVVPEEEYTIPIGPADVKRQGSNITVVSYGLMLHHCLEAAELLSQEDVDVEVVDLRTLRPLDTETIINSVKKTGIILIVEYLDGPISRLCGPDIPTMPFAQSLEEAYLPNTDKVASALRQLAQY